MNTTTISTAHFPLTDLSIYMKMGNDAIRCGNETESLKWYSKGLAKARELK